MRGARSVATRLPGFCLNRVVKTPARVRSPPYTKEETTPALDPGGGGGGGEEKPESAAEVCTEKESTAAVDSFCGGGDGEQKVESAPAPVAKSGGGRRIMIVVDGGAEAKGAIQWALTHTAQPQDTLVLLHVIKPADGKNGGGGGGGIGEECSKEMAAKAYKLVETLKNFCHLKRPELNTEVSVIKGKDKGPLIVQEAAKQGAALLVLGQKKRTVAMTWRLLLMWTGRASSGCGGGVVEYCIQNANCMAVAVRRKSKKLGGYLITTKRHKDFWLLA